MIDMQYVTFGSSKLPVLLPVLVHSCPRLCLSWELSNAGGSCQCHQPRRGANTHLQVLRHERSGGGEVHGKMGQPESSWACGRACRHCQPCHIFGRQLKSRLDHWAVHCCRWGPALLCLPVAHLCFLSATTSSRKGFYKCASLH